MTVLDDRRRAAARAQEVTGQLRERVALSGMRLVDDGHGGWTEQPGPLTPGEAYAHIESLAGSERLQALALEVAVLYVVTLRWHPQVTAGTVITWVARGLALQVNGPPVEIGTRQLLQCYCSVRGE